MCGKSNKVLKQELFQNPIDDLMALNLEMLPSTDIDLSYLQGFADIQNQPEMTPQQQPYDPAQYGAELGHSRTSSYGSSTSCESNSVDGSLSPCGGIDAFAYYPSPYVAPQSEMPQTPVPPTTPYQWPSQAFFPEHFTPSTQYSPYFHHTQSHQTPSHHTPSHNTPSHHTPSHHTPSHHTPSHHTPINISNSTSVYHTPTPTQGPVQNQAWNAHLKNFIKSNEVDASNSSFQLSSVSKSSLKMRRSRASRSKCPCVKCSSARVNGFPSPINHLCIVKGCTKSYTRPAHLRNHLKTHQNNEDLKCEICQKSFLQSEMMINHMIEHEPDLKLF